jgi:hypothetical protein
MKTCLYIFIYFLTVADLKAQTNGWVPVTPSDNSFSFAFPGQPQLTYDSLNFALYSYRSDSISLHCSFTRRDSSFLQIVNHFLAEDSLELLQAEDSMANPLYGVTEFLRYHYDSVISYSAADLPVSNESVTAREFNLVYSDYGNAPELFSMRMYYNGHDILCFTVDAPYTRMQDFAGIKNTYFNSIILN